MLEIEICVFTTRWRVLLTYDFVQLGLLDADLIANIESSNVSQSWMFQSMQDKRTQINRYWKLFFVNHNSWCLSNTYHSQISKKLFIYDKLFCWNKIYTHNNVKLVTEKKPDVSLSLYISPANSTIHNSFYARSDKISQENARWKHEARREIRET